MNTSQWLILNPAAVLQDCEQGTPAWQEYRRTRRNASEAAAMIGCDLYQSRSNLVRGTALGIELEINAGLQALFDRGHAAEAAARPLGEEVIGQPLRPCVLSYDIDGLPLSASLDGLTPDGSVAWEHKLFNAALAASLESDTVPLEYAPQLEQQLLVSGANRALLMCSDGTRDSARWAWYESNPELRARIIAGWRQFEDDVKNYQHVEYIPAAVATPTMALPALSIRVNGSLELVDNLPAFGEALTAFCKRIPTKPETDLEFANCKEACKRLQEAQDMLDASEAQALGQIATFDAMRRTKAMLWELARSTRLATEKLVAAQEQFVKSGIINEGKTAFAAHIDGLNKRIGKPWMPVVAADFVAAAKNKRTIASLRDAVSTELANGKIRANEIADRISINARAMPEQYSFLFADAASIVTKAPEDFALLVESRITAHKAAEEKKIEAMREMLRIEAAENLAKQQREEAAQVAAAQGADAAGGSAHPGPGSKPDPAPAAAPISQPAAWGLPPHSATVATLPGRAKPSGPELVEAVALHFHVSAATAADWLMNTPADEYAGWPKSA